MTDDGLSSYQMNTIESRNNLDASYDIANSY